MELSGIEWKDKKQWTQPETQGIPPVWKVFHIRKHFLLLLLLSQTLDQVAYRGCGVSILRDT